MGRKFASSLRDCEQRVFQSVGRASCPSLTGGTPVPPTDIFSFPGSPWECQSSGLCPDPSDLPAGPVYSRLIGRRSLPVAIPRQSRGTKGKRGFCTPRGLGRNAGTLPFLWSAVLRTGIIPGRGWSYLSPSSFLASSLTKPPTRGSGRPESVTTSTTTISLPRGASCTRTGIASKCDLTNAASL